jgi:hypothetical protein
VVQTKKPACAGLGGAVDFLDYMLWKAIVLVVLAFVWGIFCGWNGLGLNGRPLQQGRRAATDSESQD